MSIRSTTAASIAATALFLATSCGDEGSVPTTASTSTSTSTSAVETAAPEAGPQWQTDAGAAPTEAPRGLVHREEGASEGYTLIAPLNERTVYLVDMDGQVVHTWKTTHTPAGGAHLLPNGNLLRCARVESAPGVQRGGIGGLTQEIAWDGSVVWECDLVSEGYTQHHDLHPLPNGNVLLIVRQFHAHEDALAHGRDPRHRANAALWSDLVLEVEPIRPAGAKIVWSWDAWDHLVQDHDPKARAYGALAEHPGRIDINADHRNQPATETEEKRLRRERLEAQMRAVGYAGDDAPRDAAAKAPEPGTALTGEDWLHLNGIDYLTEHDLIVLSSRHLSELLVIDHSTTTAEAATSKGGRFGRGGEVLYRWGNPKSYGQGGPAEQQLFLQHDVTWQRGAGPNDLAILVFNNGPRGPGQDYSTVDEIAVPFDSARGFAREPGRPFGPAQARWTYSDPARFYSGFISGAQRLPNGNTLICEGAKGRVFEVRPDGHVVWDYWSPFVGDGRGGFAPQSALFHATRVPKDHPGLKSRFQ